jgi:hypothetical protein
MATEGLEGVERIGTTTTGILFFQGVRVLALLVGAVFAGAGQRQSGFLGGMVGAWNGVFSVLLLPGPTQALTPTALLGQPLLQAAIGAIGAWLGSAYWKPLPSPWSGDFGPAGSKAVSPRKRNFLRRHLKLFTGPVAWFRVSVGVGLAVAGTLSATLFFEKILDLGHGALATTDDLQDRLITMEIKALALLLGGALAGATTSNGLKQGFCVGLASTVILIGVEMNFVERWLQLACFTLVSALSLSLVGGWFGSQLFPPLVKSRRDRGLSRATL